MPTPTSSEAFAPLRDAIGQELTWQKTAMFKRNFELRQGDAVYATLVWQRSWRAAAELTATDGRWTIQQKGFWRPQIIVTDAASGMVVATFARKWTGGGVITFGPEHAYTFRRQGFFNTEWLWLTSQETPTMRIKARGFGGKARVVVEPTGAGVPGAAILAGVGWYLLIQMADESAAVAASSAAVH